MPSPFRGHPDYRHGTPERSAVLAVNLGTPEAPTASALRRYLAEFLGDPRVIELPRALWLPILYGAILPFRAPRSAKAYASIWGEGGSPLRVHSEALVKSLDASLGPQVEVALAMRYGEPSVASVLRRLDADGGLRRLLVLPLYPQYSATTSATVFDALYAELGRMRWPPEVRTINDYWAEEAWLDAVANSIRHHWARHGRGERLLFSFHGLPRRYLEAGDPYHCQCQGSAREIAARLGLSRSEWMLSFQSRVGREEWLRPYTDETVRELGRSRLKSLDVVCPGFAVDCLETLEEIAVQNAEFFTEAGGGELRYIPCLNAGSDHVAALTRLLRRHGAGWPGFDRPLPEPGEYAARAERFRDFKR